MLRDIIIDIASEGGIKITDEEQLSFVIKKINDATEEIYTSFELYCSLMEQIFDVDPANNSIQISLPHYVGVVKAARWYIPNIDLGVVDMRPHYQPKMWEQKNWLSIRVKGELPIQRDITNASILRVRFKKPVTETVTVTITGKTEYADFTREQLVFAAGEQEKLTTESFTELESITKNISTAYDAEVYDIDDNLMAVLHNHQHKTNYTLIQLLNPVDGIQQVLPPTQYMEILWKRHFRKMVNQTDEFMCPGYDKAIFWKFMEHEAARSKDPNENAKALGYAAKCSDIVAKVTKEHELSLSKSMNFGPNPYLGLYDYDYQYGSAYPISSLL